MAEALSPGDPRRLYSWWWDSHIVPKNSKWLMENLTDIDSKIKAMIKIIELDADSFARKAEMYYRKRPELMKLVEEFYRTYRALAERYDHQVGELRHAHRAMAQAFPDQVPFEFDDDLPPETAAAESDMSQFFLTFLSNADKGPAPAPADVEKLQKEIDSLAEENRDLKKQISLHIESGEKAASEVSTLRDNLLKSDADIQRLKDAIAELESEKKEIHSLAEENQELKRQISLHIEYGEKAASEVQSLRDNLLKSDADVQKLKDVIAELELEKELRESAGEAELESLKEALVQSGVEKEQALAQCKQSGIRLSSLKSDVLRTQQEFEKFKQTMQAELSGRGDAEKRCAALERENAALRGEADELRRRAEAHRSELSELQGELEKLSVQLQEERLRSIQAEMSRLSLEKKLKQSAASNSGNGAEKTVSKLEAELAKVREENKKLDEENHRASAKVIRLQDDIIGMKDAQRRLEGEVSQQVLENRKLIGELSGAREANAAADSSRRHGLLSEQLRRVNCNVESLQALAAEVRDGNAELKEIIKNHAENARQLDRMAWRNAELEMSLAAVTAERADLAAKNIEANAELSALRAKTAAAERSGIEARTENFVLRESLAEIGAAAAAERREAERLRRRCAGQEEEVQCLSAHNKKLAKGVKAVLEALKLDAKYESLEKMRDEIIFQLIVHEVRCMANAAADVHDVKQNQLLEKSLVVTLLDHFGREVADLRAERAARREEKNELLRMNEELLKKVDVLAGQLAEVQESRRSLQNEVIELLGKKQPSGNAGDCRDDGAIADAVSADVLGVVFRSLHEERTAQLQALQKSFGFLCAAGSDLYHEIKTMNDRLGGAVQVRRRRDMELLGRAGGEREQQQCQSTEKLQRANEMVKEELQKLRQEVEALRRGQQDAVRSCDADVVRLLGSIKVAISNAALFKEKVLELIMACESYEISGLVQKEVLKEEITRRNSYVDELKDKLSAVEVENSRLKVDLNGDFTLLGSLQHELDALERQTLSLARDCFPLKKHHRKEESSTSAMSASPRTAKSIKMQRLHTTIKALQKVVSDTGELLEQERVDLSANLADARKQVEMMKMKSVSVSDEDLSSEANYENMLKDIQLDLVHSSSERVRSFRQQQRERRKDGAALGFWGVVGANNGDMEHPEVERPSSEMIIEKEMCTDQRQQLLAAAAAEPCGQEWTRRITEKISSDTEKITALQSSVRELKRSVDAGGEDAEASDDAGSIKDGIREAEMAIVQLVEANRKLTKKADEFTAASESDRTEVTELRRSHRKIVERSRKVSEKIGRLEMELQRLQQAVVRREEEMASKRAKAAAAAQQRRTRVLLVEYLYGRRRDSRKQKAKRGPACGCMRAKAQDD